MSRRADTTTNEDAMELAPLSEQQRSLREFAALLRYAPGRDRERAFRGDLQLLDGLH